MHCSTSIKCVSSICKALNINEIAVNEIDHISSDIEQKRKVLEAVHVSLVGI